MDYRQKRCKKNKSGGNCWRHTNVFTLNATPPVLCTIPVLFFFFKMDSSASKRPPEHVCLRLPTALCETASR